MPATTAHYGQLQAENGAGDDGRADDEGLAREDGYSLHACTSVCGQVRYLRLDPLP
jgi:hypothetical protein